MPTKSFPNITHTIRLQAWIIQLVSNHQAGFQTDVLWMALQCYLILDSQSKDVSWKPTQEMMKICRKWIRWNKIMENYQSKEKDEDLKNSGLFSRNKS